MGRTSDESPVKSSSESRRTFVAQLSPSEHKTRLQWKDEEHEAGYGEQLDDVALAPAEKAHRGRFSFLSRRRLAVGLFVLLGVLVFAGWNAHADSVSTQSLHLPGMPQWDTSAADQSALEAAAEEKPEPHRILLAIFTTHDPAKVRRRHVLRTVYSHAQTLIPDDVVFDVRFVVGQAREGTSDAMTSTEASTYRDILELEVSENMNDGKTWAFFDHVRRRLLSRLHYDLVLKVDDDAYLHLPNAVAELRPHLGKQQVHWGNQCNQKTFPSSFQEFPYMCGATYGLSGDIVQQIDYAAVMAASAGLPGAQRGAEDAELGYWLVRHGLTANWIFSGTAFLDYDPANQGDETVMIHNDLHDALLVAHHLKQEKYLLEVVHRYLGDVPGLQPEGTPPAQSESQQQAQQVGAADGALPQGDSGSDGAARGGGGGGGGAAAAGEGKAERPVFKNAADAGADAGASGENVVISDADVQEQIRQRLASLPQLGG